MDEYKECLCDFCVVLPCNSAVKLHVKYHERFEFKM